MASQMTPEQSARQLQSMNHLHSVSQAAQQQQLARNYAAGYRNRGPGQRGYLPGGQSLSYNANSGQIYSGVNHGQNAYQVYPMTTPPAVAPYRWRPSPSMNARRLFGF